MLPPTGIQSTSFQNSDSKVAGLQVHVTATGINSPKINPANRKKLKKKIKKLILAKYVWYKTRRFPTKWLKVDQVDDKKS